MSLWITTGPSKRPSSQASIIKTPAGQSQETMALSSPLQTCLECGASARKERAIEARLYGLDGVHPIEHWTKKCSNRSCATLHHYNYRWVDGNKTRSTARVPEILTLLSLIPRQSFLDLDYHGALQFRGHISIHAINFAQKEVMWKDASEHARWRLEYSTAQLYLSVLHVSELMWRNFADNYMEEKLPRLAWTHRLLATQ